MSRNVVITGANRGIGLGLVQACIQAGFRVFATYRRPEQSQELLELTSQHEGRLSAVALDVSDQASVDPW